MKKFYTLLLTCCLLLAVCAMPTAATNQGKTYLAPYGTPTVDGVMDNVWYLAPWAKTTTGNPSSIFAKFKVLHDDTYVYFLFQYTDTEVSMKMNECIQLALHEDSCGLGWSDGCPFYSVHLLQCNGTLWCQIDPDAPEAGKSVMFDSYQVENVDGTFTMEISLKLDKGIPLDDGIFMEVVMEDYTEDSKWIPPRAWNGDNARYRDMSDFGVLYFLPDEGAEIPTGEIYEEEPDPEVVTTQAPVEEEPEDPAVNEPVENDPAEVKPEETKPVETKPSEEDPAVTTDAADDVKAPAAFPVVPVAAVVIALGVIAILIVVLTKKKKK